MFALGFSNRRTPRGEATIWWPSALFARTRQLTPQAQEETTHRFTHSHAAATGHGPRGCSCGPIPTSLLGGAPPAGAAPSTRDAFFGDGTMPTWAVDPDTRGGRTRPQVHCPQGRRHDQRDHVLQGRRPPMLEPTWANCGRRRARNWLTSPSRARPPAGWQTAPAPGTSGGLGE